MKRVWCAAWFGFLVIGCDPATELPAPEPPPATSMSQAHTVEGVLSSYEAIRALLADDDIRALGQRAQLLERQATGAARQTSSSELVAIARAARELKARRGEIESARGAFGELSKQVVALLVANPGLREGLQIFECPMAPGYQKWVQPRGKLNNPYMGKEMLGCGRESDWSS